MEFFNPNFLIVGAKYYTWMKSSLNFLSKGLKFDRLLLDCWSLFWKIYNIFQVILLTYLYTVCGTLKNEKKEIEKIEKYSVSISFYFESPENLIRAEEGKI